MSPETREKIELEMAQLRRQAAVIKRLAEGCQGAEPTEERKLALAAALHGFYNGVENIFKRITLELDKKAISGDNWHHEILFVMTKDVGDRPPVLTELLAKALQKYLDFRHLFRHAYSDNIDWNRMKPLVFGLAETHGKFEAELGAWLKKV